MNIRRFITDYINYNDGKSLADKSKTVQAIAASAFAAYPASVVIPLPAEESIQLQVQSMIASAYRVLQTVQDPRIFQEPSSGYSR